MAKPRTKTSGRQVGEKPDPSSPATSELRDVPLDQIPLGGSTQIRAWVCPDIVTKYAADMQEGEEFPPVVVFFDGKQYWMADGHHRREAAQQVGHTTIRAEVREGGEREARFFAAGANRTHGLWRTTLDMERAVLVLLNDEEWRQWSDRAIARHCGVSHQFVAKFRRMGVSGRDDQIAGARTVRRGETVYTMNTSGIGSHAETPTPANGQPGSVWQDDEHDQDDEEFVPLVSDRTTYEYMMNDLHNRLLVLVEDIKQAGGIKAVWDTWTRERREEFLAHMASIEDVWKIFAVEVQAAAPQTPLTPAPGAKRSPK